MRSLTAFNFGKPVGNFDRKLRRRGLRRSKGAGEASPRSFGNATFTLPSAAPALRTSTALGRGLHIETLEPRLLLSADLIPISGSIEVPGQTTLYTFQLTEPRRVLFDALTPNSGLTWALDGVAGPLVAPTAFTQSDAQSGGSVLALDSGDYTLRVDGNGDTTGAYSFRLLNLDNAPVIDTGLAVTGRLESLGRETDLFQFAAAAGTELYLDAQALSSGSANWSLLGPDGVAVFSKRAFLTYDDPARLIVPRTGTYTLLLEGSVSNGAASDYRFTVYPVADRTQALAVDTPVLDRLVSPGSNDRYTFTLAESGRLWFDALSNSGVLWSLIGPRGAEVTNREIRLSDSTSQNPALDLLAGDYVLTIGNSSDRIGHYAFRLLTDASAVAALARGSETWRRCGP